MTDTAKTDDEDNIDMESKMDNVENKKEESCSSKATCMFTKIKNMVQGFFKGGN